jgi:tetratricopeptide (TPR) repeat protein
MRQIGIILLISAFVLCGAGSSHFLLAQHDTAPPDWKALLEKAQAGIEKNPNSAFWHNQASVAYSALGYFDLAVKELKLASSLDPDDPGHEYGLFALYQRKGMLRQQREALLSALEIEGRNPLGHFELGVVLEKEGYLEESLKEYRDAKRLAADVKSKEYTDRRGGVYEVEVVRKNADEYIERVTKLIAAKQGGK